VDEGGRSVASATERADLLVKTLTAGCGFIDIEYQTWSESAAIRKLIRSVVPVDSISHTSGSVNRLILSHHDMTGRPSDAPGLLRAMQTAVPDAVLKLVWNVQSVVESFEALELMRTSRQPIMAICIGKSGVLTRVLAGKFGAFATYCAADGGPATAPGQLTLSQMLDHYRWRAINRQTKWYGLLGDPVWHSPGPAVFTGSFQDCGINAVYLPIELPIGENTMTSFLEAVDARPWLDFAGASVTVPHKQNACAWLNDSLDPTARRVGAVNTLVRSGETWRGHNTDYDGLLDALTETLDCTRADLAGQTADVLGAGGAARAIVAALVDCRVNVTVYNRTADRAAAVANDFGCRWAPWAQRDASRADLLINATTLGSPAAPDRSPVSNERLSTKPVVVDMVYSACPTRLLAAAKSAECRVIDGLEVYARQAAHQFRLWTGSTKSPSLLRELAEVFLDDTQADPLQTVARSVHAWGLDRATRGHVILIGYRGSGKSTVGPLLAERLGLPFVDTDQEIAQRAGKTITQVFDAEGEDAFREHEREVIAEVCTRDPHVIAVGGGAVLDDDNTAAMRQAGAIVWLTATANTLWKRIAADSKSQDQRPNLSPEGGGAEVQRLLDARQQRYRGAADWEVDTEGVGPSEATDQLVRQLRHGGIG